MEFRETLLAAQRNQQQKSSEKLYYKAKFDPPKKEQKQRDKLSANIQKFLAKKDEEEKQKKLEAQRKREELSAMRDPKALRKIQKTLKVIKSANKSVIQDAIDNDNTAVTRDGPEQPDQDDYGYESQEAAALYEKMMEKYSKIPEQPKFPVGNSSVKKDLNGTRERVKHALQHEDDPVPHKRKRRTENVVADRESSPPSKYEPEKKKEEKPEKPKIRKPVPPPMDFNQLLKLAEQKKSEPVGIGSVKKATSEPEPEKLMTKKQRREYEEEMARRQRRQERMDAEKAGGRKIQRDDRQDRREPERERKVEPSGFGRIPKLGDKSTSRTDSPKSHDKDRERYERERAEKLRREKERVMLDREKSEREKSEREKSEREKLRQDRERLDKLKAERDRIDREMERLNKDRDRLDKTKSKLESKTVDRKPVDKSNDRPKLASREPVRQEAKKNIDLKSQNTYRIDKNSNEKRPVAVKNDGKHMNGHSIPGKPMPKSIVPSKDGSKGMMQSKKPLDGSPKLNGQAKLQNGKQMPDTKGMTSKRPEDRKSALQAGPSKPKVSNNFDFDKHVNSLGNKNVGKQFPAGHVKRKPGLDDRKKPKRRLESDSEYDSEMDDFIDDGDENLDYSSAIKEIFGYDKARYRDMDDDDDPNMESSFAQQQREEYISKKHGIMEDLEDMRLEALEKKKSKNKRRISDD